MRISCDLPVALGFRADSGSNQERTIHPTLEFASHPASSETNGERQLLWIGQQYVFNKFD